MAATLSAREVNDTRFNKEAVDWDANKKHVETCERAFEAIKRHVPAFADGSSKSTSARGLSMAPSLQTNN